MRHHHTDKTIWAISSAEMVQNPVMNTMSHLNIISDFDK